MTETEAEITNSITAAQSCHLQKGQSKESGSQTTVWASLTSAEKQSRYSSQDLPTAGIKVIKLLLCCRDDVPGNRRLVCADKLTCALLTARQWYCTVTQAVRKFILKTTRKKEGLKFLVHVVDFFFFLTYMSRTVLRTTRSRLTFYWCNLLHTYGVSFLYSIHQGKRGGEDTQGYTNTKLHSEERRWKERPDFCVTESVKHKSFWAFVYVGPVFHSSTPTVHSIKHSFMSLHPFVQFGQIILCSGMSPMVI